MISSQSHMLYFVVSINCIAQYTFICCTTSSSDVSCV